MPQSTDELNLEIDKIRARIAEQKEKNEAVWAAKARVEANIEMLEDKLEELTGHRSWKKAQDDLAQLAKTAQRSLQTLEQALEEVGIDYN